MGKIEEFVKNKEHLKIAIKDYGELELDIINFTDEYLNQHWECFKRKLDKKEISDREFSERLYNYLWIPKVSELIIILYLEDLKGIAPSIYEANKLLRRTSDQYSSTFKSVKKLEELDIVFTKVIKKSNRKKKQIFINKKMVNIYGDDEFKQMMLDEWNTYAKTYIKRRLNCLSSDKEAFEKRILMIKKGKRGKR